MNKQIKSARHHYWPEVLSAYWADSEGQVTRLNWNGSKLRAPPKNFGVIRDGHSIKYRRPLGETFEPFFQQADSSIPDVMKCLRGLDSKAGIEKHSLKNRLKPQPLPSAVFFQLCEILASLVVRSPEYKNRFQVTADTHFNNILGESKEMARNVLIRNMAMTYEEVVQNFLYGGKLVILFTDSQEFIFGDGFFHDIAGMPLLSPIKCLVPLSPTMTVGFFRPSRYVSEPNAVTLRLTPGEVKECNDITQVYTKEYIYFRNDCPVLNEAFTCGKFQQFPDHRHSWVDQLFETVAWFDGG